MKNTRKRSLSKLQNRLRKINRTIKNTESLVKLGTFSGNVSMLDGFKDERQRLVEHIDTKLLNAAYPELKNLRRSRARGKTRRRLSFSNSTR
jgi:asparagine synthetase A